MKKRVRTFIIAYPSPSGQKKRVEKGEFLRRQAVNFSFKLCKKNGILKARVSAKALGSKKASHVVVTKPIQNPHDLSGRSGFKLVLRLALHLLSAP